MVVLDDRHAAAAFTAQIGSTCPNERAILEALRISSFLYATAIVHLIVINHTDNIAQNLHSLKRSEWLGKA